MNDLATAITPEIQVKIDAVNRAKEELEYSAINLGKRLCELKDSCPHGGFTQIAEQYTGLKKSHCQNLMRIYNTFGQKPSRLGFSTQVLIELTNAPEPEKLLEDCEPNITVKEAKEKVRLAKAEARKEALQGSFDKMIPMLKKQVENGLISEEEALKHSILDEKAQANFVKSELDKRAENSRAERDRARLGELGEEIDKLKAEKERLEGLASPDTSKLIADKEFEIKKLKDEFQRKEFELRKEAEKQASELHEKRFKEQIISLEEEKKKLERQKKEASDKASASWGKYKDMQSEIDKLKSQLEVDNPTNVDNARERHIQDAGRGFLISINELRKDMDKLGGGMEASLETANEIIKKATLELAKLQESQNAIINI